MTNTRIDRKIILLLFVLAIYHNVFSQQETKGWFMYNTRADISSSGITTGLNVPPAFLSYQGTKSTSLSDANGNLLFAFNGNTIVDVDLEVMPALIGVDLLAVTGKTLIQQIPSSTQYYIFYATQNNTSDANSSWTLKYLIVDLSLRGGKGDVITYDHIISTTSSPSYTLVESEDGANIWLVTHKCATDTFYNYRITHTGLAGAAVMNKAGSNPADNRYIFKSLKTSFNGKMLAGYSFREFYDAFMFLGTQASIDVFDFDAESGMLSHRVHTIRGTGNRFHIFSLEFSPDNRLLYVGSVLRMAGLQPCGLGGGNIRQYNLCYTNSVEFERYSMTIAGETRRCAPFTTWGSMQMGADKKIHIPFTGNVVSTINKTNRIGTSSNFVFDSYQLPQYNDGTIITPDFHHRMVDRAVRNNIVYEGGCFPSPITFRVTNDKLSSVNWNFDDPSSVQNTINSMRPSHVFSSPGFYTVTARFLNNITDEMETIEELIEIKDPDKRLLDAYPQDTTICEGEGFMINLRVVNGVYQWYTMENDEKVYLSESSDSYLVNSSGMHYVELRWNDCNSCILVDSINVTVKPKPWIPLDDRTLCSGDSLKVGFYEPDTRYLWNTGQTMPEITIKSGGIYWLEAEYNNNGCIVRDTMKVTDLRGVQFDLPGDTVLCGKEELLLAPTVTGVGNYRWQDNSTDPYFVVTEPGVYHLQVTSVDYCYKRDTIMVEYIRDEAVYLGNDTVLCRGDRLELSSVIPNAQFLWSTGSTAASIEITDTDEYWVQASNGKCTSADTIFVQFMLPPVFDLGSDTTLCPGSSLVLKTSVAEADHVWQDESSHSTFTVKEPGEYFVSVQKFGCIAGDTITVNYFNTSKIDMGEDLRFCEGDSVQLDAGAGFTSYHWNNGSRDQRQIVKHPGMYFVTVVSAEGCSLVDTVLVLPPYPAPKPELGNIRGICEGGTILLDGGAGFISYVWNTGERSRILKVEDTGLYTVEVEDRYGCLGRGSINIPVRFKPPTGFLSPDTGICLYEEMLLGLDLQYESYLWSTGSTDAVLLITSPGVYRLTVKDENGCSGYDSIEVHRKECMEGIYVPNAFTPNTDGKNDGFRPLLYGIVETYKFEVFNRYGHLVFQSETPGESWNGVYQGRAQNSGAYVWKCVFKIRGYELRNISGTVLLIR